jgi:hypothetical protein
MPASRPGHRRGDGPPGRWACRPASGAARSVPTSGTPPRRWPLASWPRSRSAWRSCCRRPKPPSTTANPGSAESVPTAPSVICCQIAGKRARGGSRPWRRSGCGPWRQLASRRPRYGCLVVIARSTAPAPWTTAQGGESGVDAGPRVGGSLSLPGWRHAIGPAVRFIPRGQGNSKATQISGGGRWT